MIRSVPPYPFGGTVSIGGATWAMRKGRDTVGPLEVGPDRIGQPTRTVQPPSRPRKGGLSRATLQRHCRLMWYPSRTRGYRSDGAGEGTPRVEPHGTERDPAGSR